MSRSVVDAGRLTDFVKPREIWKFNFLIWILQAEQNYVRIHYSIKKIHTSAFILSRKGGYFLEFIFDSVSQVHTASYPFQYLYLEAYCLGFGVSNLIDNR